MTASLPASDTTPRLGRLFLASLVKLSSVQPGERVLDLRALDGDATLTAAARTGDQGEVLTLDSDESRLTRVVQQAQAAGQSVVRGERSTAVTLPGPDSYWDVLLCHLALPTMDDPPASLREAVRVLRPVGRMGVSVWGERARCPLLTLFLEAIAPHAPAAATLDRALFRYSAPGVMAVTLADAGFQDAVPERLTEWPAFRDVDQYWDVMAADHQLGPVAATLSTEQVAEAKAEIERKTRFYRRASGIELKVEGVILAAVK